MSIQRRTRYIYGDGSPLVIENAPGWSEYMMASEWLTVRTGNYLAPIKIPGERGIHRSSYRGSNDHTG